MKNGYLVSTADGDNSVALGMEGLDLSEKSDEDDLEDDLSTMTPYGERLTTPEVGGHAYSRNSSFSSGHSDQHFHVMKRRNAFIQLEVNSVTGDMHELAEAKEKAAAVAA